MTRKAEESIAEDLLAYRERIATETLAQAHSAYDLACERIYKLLPIMMAAASAIGVFGIQVAEKRPTIGAPLLALAVWVCLVAAYLVLKGARSNKVFAGTDSRALEARSLQLSNTMGERGLSSEVFGQLRKDQLSSTDDQIAQFASLTSNRSTALDRAYQAIVIGTPIAVATGYLVALRWPTLFMVS